MNYARKHKRTMINITSSIALSGVSYCVESIRSFILDFIKHSPILFFFILSFLILSLFFLAVSYSKIHIRSLKEVTIGHESFTTWSIIKKAKHEIILHAAYYPKYSLDEKFSNAILELFRRNHSIRLTVVVTDTTQIWSAEFGKILRFYDFESIEDFKKAVDSSMGFFCKLERDYPNNVIVKKSCRIPLTPIVIIDNSIYAGHYCHSIVPTPAGVWMHFENEIVLEAIDKIRNCGDEAIQQYIDSLDDEDKAIVRYIEEALDSTKK